MFAMTIHRLMWIDFLYYTLDIRFYLSLFVNLQSHFSNFADLRQLQIPNAQTKYYENLPGHTKTPLNTTHKIANRYFELQYHFLTLQKKTPITFEQGCTMYLYSIMIQYSAVITRPIFSNVFERDTP